MKIDLRVATITAAERVPKTDKLMKLEVRIGEEERTIVSGIAQHYTAEELIGRNVIVIANLKAAKLRGIESRGMLLAASDGEGKLVLADAPRYRFREQGEIRCHVQDYSIPMPIWTRTILPMTATRCLHSCRKNWTGSSIPAVMRSRRVSL